MNRSRSRTSRVLLIILMLAVLVGVFTFASKYRRNALAADPAKPSAAKHSAPRGIEGDFDTAVVTRTPTSGPSMAKPRAATTSPTTRSTSAKSSATTLPAILLSSKPLADAKAKADANQLIEARDIYNAALLSGKLSADETRAAKEALAALNETIVFSSRRFEADPWGGTFTVPPGGVLAKIAKRFDVTPQLLARINNLPDPKRLRADQTIKILKGPLHAVVDKSDFTLNFYFGSAGGPDSSYVATYRVGLGTDDSTPTGTWLVEPNKKLTNPTYYSPRGEGVIDADDPKNPLGEYWIGLTGTEGGAVGKSSYGIHGTIDPESIGTMASMGCIRMLNEDVARVFELLVEGKSTVVVVE